MAQRLAQASLSAAVALETSEELLNTLDQESGDGDCGSCHRRGAQALRKAVEKGTESPQAFISALARLLQTEMGGTSGAVYSLFFTAAAPLLEHAVAASDWCNAMQTGIAAITKYSGAEPGDRTLLDPLNAACCVLKTSPELVRDPMSAFEKAVLAAEECASATAQWTARAGRASYVRSATLTQEDPGARAVAIWMRALLETLKKNTD